MKRQVAIAGARDDVITVQRTEVKENEDGLSSDTQTDF